MRGGSWALLGSVLPWGKSPLAHLPFYIWDRWALYLRRGRRWTSTPQMVQYWERWVGVYLLGLLVLVLVAGTNAYTLVLVLLAPLMVLAPSLLLLIPILAWSLAPVIARERERQRWQDLRLTPHTVDVLVLSKTQAALSRHRPLAIMLARAIVLIGGTLLAISPSGDVLRAWGVDSLISSGSLGWIAVRALLVVIAPILFIGDRAQQGVLLILAALLASARSRSVRMAQVGALSAGIVVWLTEISAAYWLVAALPESSPQFGVGRLVTLVVLGPGAFYWLTLSFEVALVVSVGTLILREGVIAGMWRWVQHAAQQV